jgi:hypothetical protein
MKKIISYFLFLTISLNSFAGHYVSNEVADTTKPLTRPLQQTKDSNVLVVIDGKIAGTIKELKSIDDLVKPDSIRSVNVLKGKEAIDKYGEKGKEGVVEIYTKATTVKEVRITDIKQSEAPDDADDSNKIFDRVEIEASFPGGDQVWRRYLERTLNGSTPVDHGAPHGTYTVVVQFVVDKEGNISNVTALTNHGYGMEQEVVRVITKGPKWNPAIQDGRQVKASRRQPVTFVVMKEDEPEKKKKKNRD